MDGTKWPSGEDDLVASKEPWPQPDRDYMALDEGIYLEKHPISVLRERL